MGIGSVVITIIARSSWDRLFGCSRVEYRAAVQTPDGEVLTEWVDFESIARMDASLVQMRAKDEAT